MTEEKIQLPVDSALIPAFYQNFHCLAQDCRDCCCGGWQIRFGKKDYLRLRRLDAPPALKERLEQSVRREKAGNHDGAFYGKFDIESNNDRCPLLDPDGLCAIQRVCGHNALPDVCMSYPRKIRYSPAAKEYSLSPSCEGVLQQLWDLPDGVEFVEDPLPKAERRKVNIPQGENLILYFTPLRSLFVDILQNRAMPLTDRMLCLGITIQRLQGEAWDIFDPDSWVEQANLLTGTSAMKEMIANIPGNRRLYLMKNMEVLSVINYGTSKTHWSAEIYNTLEVEQTFAVKSKENGEAEKSASLSVHLSPKAYADALTQFQTTFSGYEYFFENLMVALALYLGFPDLGSRDSLWRSYVALCDLYSFLRFVTVLGCKEKNTKEQLFHMIAMATRDTLHKWEGHDFQEKLFHNDSAALSQMAILLRG